MTASSSLRRGRGKPAVERREQFLAKIWLMVYEERVAFGAKNNSAACRSIIDRHPSLRIMEPSKKNDGKPAARITVLSWRALLDLFNEAERVRAHGDCDSFLVRFTDAKKAAIDAHTIGALHPARARAIREGAAGLRHTDVVGKRPPTVEDLDRLFKG